MGTRWNSRNGYGYKKLIAISITATAAPLAIPTNRLQYAWGPLGFGADRTMIRSNRQAVCSFCGGTIDLVGEKNKVHEALRAAGRTAMKASSSSTVGTQQPQDLTRKELREAEAWRPRHKATIGQNRAALQ